MILVDKNSCIKINHMYKMDPPSKKYGNKAGIKEPKDCHTVERSMDGKKDKNIILYLVHLLFETFHCTVHKRCKAVSSLLLFLAVE